MSRPALPLDPRRAKRLRLAAIHGRRRLLFGLGGVLIGLAAWLLAVAADRCSSLFGALLANHPIVTLALTPLGFAACRALTLRFFPTAGGSGIPQAIAARQLPTRAEREPLVSLRTAGGKMALLLLGLLCGASIGREGPTVQVGASIMFALGRLSPRRQPGLILAGASAGVAAAFNTPLAGIVFGIEEMSRAYETRTSGVVLGAVIVAGITALAIQGDYTYFGTTHAALQTAEAWAAVPLLGVAGGVLGGLYSRTLILFGTGLPGTPGRLMRQHPILFAALCGAAVAGAGWLSHGTAYGTGYAQARALVNGDAAGVPQSFGLLKLLATTASSVSGIPGGIFAPSLAVGAGLGANFAALLPGTPFPAMVVIGMVAYFAGVVQAPITAFVIVTEMTNDHALLLPLMVAAVIAYATSRLVCPEGVYHALARNFMGAAGHAPHT